MASQPRDLPPTELLNMRKVAERLGLSYGRVRTMRSEGTLPDADIEWDGRPYWHDTTIARFAAERTAAST